MYFSALSPNAPCPISRRPGFTRGQTQALSVLTLGALGDYQLIDGLGPEQEKRFSPSIS
jgi:hypothetical protein